MVTTKVETVTEGIAKFIAKTKYEQIPKKAIETAKRGILDWLGNCLFGCAEPEGKIILDYVKEMGGSPEATVFGSGFKAPAVQAALANGVMAAASHSGDTSLAWGVGHPTQTMLPAILAVGEKYGISGKEVLEAHIVGFEVGSRIGSGLTRHYDLGWHTTATVGTLAATAATAKVMKLDVHQCQMALGLAASVATGLKRQFGTMGLTFNTGKTAMNGVIVTALAKRGFTSDDNILEGADGFAHLMTNGQFDLEQMKQGLGSSYDIMSPGGLYLKAYPTCHLAQWHIGMLFYLVRNHNIKFNDVAEITCHVPAFFIPTLMFSRPKTGAEAVASMEYCLAAVLLDGEVTPRQFTDEKVMRSEVQEFFERVKLIPIEGAKTVAESMKQPQAIVVKLKNGKEYRREADYPHGDTLRDPMADEEIANKFRDHASVAFSQDQIGRVLELGWKLETLPKISDLTRLIINRAK